MNSSFNGTGVAIVTPFLHGNVDFDGLAKAIEHMLDGGVDFLVALGTTGESVTLTKQEKHQVLDFVVQQVNGRVPVVAGFGGNDTAAVIREMEGYHFNGIDAILSVSPAYNKPTQEGIFQHYMALAQAAPRPIIIYNVPSRTASNVSAETTLRLAYASDKFIGIKEASGDMRQCMEIINRRPEGFLVLSGDDNSTLPIMALGGEGVISVVANALPKAFSQMVRHCQAGNFSEARKLHYHLMPVVDLLFVDGNPAGVKGVLEMLGVCSKEVRLPLVHITNETYAKLEKLIVAANSPFNAMQR